MSMIGEYEPRVIYCLRYGRVQDKRFHFWKQKINKKINKTDARNRC